MFLSIIGFSIKYLNLIMIVCKLGIFFFVFGFNVFLDFFNVVEVIIINCFSIIFLVFVFSGLILSKLIIKGGSIVLIDVGIFMGLIIINMNIMFEESGFIIKDCLIIGMLLEVLFLMLIIMEYFILEGLNFD